MSGNPMLLRLPPRQVGIVYGRIFSPLACRQCLSPRAWGWNCRWSSSVGDGSPAAIPLGHTQTSGSHHFRGGNGISANPGRRSQASGRVSVGGTSVTALPQQGPHPSALAARQWHTESRLFTSATLPGAWKWVTTSRQIDERTILGLDEQCRCVIMYMCTDAYFASLWERNDYERTAKRILGGPARSLCRAASAE